MGGGKSGSTGTQQQTSTVSIPPEVLARYNSVNASAQDVAQNPFQPYTGNFVAPINPTQQQGMGQIINAAQWIPQTYGAATGTLGAGLGAAQPYYGTAGSNISSGLAGGQGANQAALGQYGAALGAAQPYNTSAAGLYGGAAGLAGAGTAAVNPTAVDSNAIGQYMSPYNQAVVQSTMALLGQQQAQQQNQLKTQQILGGSFGGDRSGIDRAVLSGQQNLASANVASNLYNQNYGQALGAAQQQQGVGLGAAQANRAALQTGAGQLTNLGQATAGLGQQVYGQGTGQAQFTGQIGQQGYGQALGAAQAQQGLGQTIFNTGLGAANAYNQFGTQALQSQLAQGQAEIGAGTLAQQTEQAQLQAQYNQFLQAQAYPFQTTQFMANIAEGTGALSGSSTSANNYTPQPFFSDRRLKENIKTIAHTKAGIPIVQYNYKGRPGTQIGLIAQDVEKHRPDAVGLAHGYKTVDYERALRAGGGGVGLAGGGPAMVIYHIGGSVDEDDVGRGFGTGYADGGSPGMDPSTMAAMLAAHQAMYPGAAGRAGMDSGPRGLQLHQPSGRSLMKADLIKPQDQQQSQTRNAAQGLGDVAGAGKSAAAIYDMGKDAAVGSAAKGTPGTSGYTPATGGLAGTGGKWDPQNGWFGKLDTGLGAANNNTPSASSVTTQPLPDITPPPAVGADTLADAGSGVVDDALSSAWAWRGGRQKRYASGGMPYGDAGDGYIPDDLYEPIDAGDLAKEQKGMGAPLARFDEGGGKSKSSTGKSAGSLAGGLAGAYFGPMGSMVGSGLGGLLGGALDNKRGGRVGYEAGGTPDTYDDSTPRIDWDQVIPKEPGLNPERPAPRDSNVIPFPSHDQLRGLNPERPAARELDDKAAALYSGKPDDYGGETPQPTAGVAPPTAAPAASAAPPAPTPGLAPPTRVNEPPGFRSPGMQTMPAPSSDQFSRMLQQESGTSQFYPAGHEKAGQPVTSSKGATGIAQVMPGTGPEAAKLAGVPWDPALFSRRATGDPKLDDEAKQYNLTLGRAYYNEQLRTFGDPNVASAAYNAGPRAVQNALQQAKATGRDYLSFLPKETQDYVRIVSGRGGGGTMALNAPATGGLGGGATGPGLNPPKDFLDRAGDWYDRNEKRIVPALAFLGSMLSSPSRTLAGSIGSGLVGGAQALQGQQQIGQGQQRIDITKNSQVMSLWAQVRQMYLASKTQANPDGDPGLKAQMERLAGMMQQNVGGTGGAGGAAPSAPPPEGLNLPAGGPGPNLAPTAQPPAPIVYAGGPAAPAGAPGVPPALNAPSQPVPPAALPPSMRVPEPRITPEFLAQLPDSMNPTKLEELGNQLAAAGDQRGQQYLQQANQIKAKINEDGGAVGKNNTFIDLPGARELKQAQQRSGENNEWQVKQGAVFQDRQIMKQSVDEIVNQLQRFEPGEFSKIKSDIQGAIRGATGMTPPSTSTMNAEAYQIFLKNAKAIVTAAPSGDANTDAARKLLEDAFTGPDKQPGAVRDVLAKAKGRLEYADQFLDYAQPKIHQEGRLDRTMLAREFEKEHPLQSFVDRNYDSMAVRGHLPEPIKEGKVPTDVIGKAYIMSPAEVQKFVGRGSLDDIRSNPELGFGGANTPKRFRVVVNGGRAQLVPQ